MILTTFLVSDMHCESCPKVIAMDLEDTPGVATVNASLQTKKVDVEFDPTLTSPDKLIEVIKTSGYTATIL